MGWAETLPAYCRDLMPGTKTGARDENGDVKTGSASPILARMSGARRGVGDRRRDCDQVQGGEDLLGEFFEIEDRGLE